MFRVRRIYDDILPVNKEAIEQVQNILRSQFHLLSEEDIDKLPDQLRDPLKYRFRSILFIADDAKGAVKGFALMLHATDLNFFYLDFISTEKQTMGRGIGSILYERVREEARSLKTIGIFFESLPDDPNLCRDPLVLKQNASRLRFYEKYGARPIINTLYETPLKPGGDNPPYLLYDDLGQDARLPLGTARMIIRAILERKYGHLCPREYIKMVVDSFTDDPVLLRKPRYMKNDLPKQSILDVPFDKRIMLVINEKHSIHHVRERGYVESPVRIKSILKEIRRTNFFHDVNPSHFSERHITAIHNPGYVDYFKKVCSSLSAGKSVYPYVFPIRNAARPPRELSVRAGYYCIDTFTPINGNAFLAAKRAVDCALTAADEILKGHRIAYALVRPPGHHAERNVFGGFCYFNSTAIAAHYLSSFGRVAVLDIDYHHGNGTQDIFYSRADVLTISIHGHPNFTYPYFSGYEEEKGAGAGEGFNINIPLPENINGIRFREALKKAIRHIQKFKPAFFIIALGLDTAKGDPTGTWNLTKADFEENGKMLGSLLTPTVVIQEGGYDSRVLGINARAFFTGLWSGSQS